MLSFCLHHSPLTIRIPNKLQFKPLRCLFLLKFCPLPLFQSNILFSNHPPILYTIQDSLFEVSHFLIIHHHHTHEEHNLLFCLVITELCFKIFTIFLSHKSELCKKKHRNIKRNNFSHFLTNRKDLCCLQIILGLVHKILN
jgi:hypothetical protein